MSATPASTFANPEQLIADLQNQLAEREAQLAEAQRNLTEATTERQEALAREAATTEVLGVINSSPGDLKPVFDAILDKAMRLCEAAFGHLDIYDGERFETIAMKNAPAAFAEFRIKNPPNYGAGTGPARMLAGERVFQHLDVKKEDAYRRGEPNRRALVDLGGARSVLQVALAKEQALLGFITLFRQEVRPFTENQIALMQNFAAQAVIAMENARLLTETREALEQQTATAEVLGVINASPGNLAPVFDAMLERAMRLCEAAFGALTTYDGQRFTPVAAHNVPPAFADFRRERGPFPPPPGSSLERVAKGEDLVHIADVANDPNQAATPLVKLGGCRALLCVALRKDAAVVGAITAYRKQARPFTDKQIALLQNFAAQAVVAMENARLLGDLQQRTAELTARDADNRALIARQVASIEVLKAISSSSGDPQPVLDLIVRHAHDQCNAQAATIVEYDGTLLHQRAWHGGDPAVVAPLLAAFPRPPGRETIPGRVVLSGQIVHVADVQADLEIFQPGRDIGARSFYSVPLLREGRVMGVLGLTRFEPGEFDEFAVTLVQSFAEHAVIALENARLIGQLQHRTKEVAALNRGLEARVAEQVEELGRVGRLKRFLAPQLAELIVSQGDEKILESHRREIVVVFCDLRGYTAFTETAEPEEVLDFLREYHGALGPLVSQFEGTLDQFSGDGIMVFFNDPVPIPDPAERAVKMAVSMRQAAGELITRWHSRGCELGFGVGIAWGYATLGQIGFRDRSGYTAIGTVCNLAARLCDEAKDAQILVTGRVAAAVGQIAVLEEVGNLSLKGLSRRVAAFNIVESTSPAEARPNLTVIAGSSGT